MNTMLGFLARRPCGWVGCGGGAHEAGGREGGEKEGAHMSRGEGGMQGAYSPPGLGPTG